MNSRTIPKVIVQFWNDIDKPSDIKGLMNSWRVENSDFEYKCFNTQTAATFIESNYGNETVQLFLKAKLPAMQSDIFRVAYCLKNGGLYIDAASKCILNLGPLVEKEEKLLVMRKWHGGICNGIVAAPPSNPILMKIWEEILQNLRDQSINDVWKATGPGLFNKFCDDPINSSSTNIYKQLDLKKYFLLVNDLKHKGEQHWSKKQKEISIYNTLEVKDIKKVLPKIYIHLGHHKTASTSFQNFLELNEAYLNSNKIGLVTVRSKFSTAYKELRVDYTRIIQGSLLSKSPNMEQIIHQLVQVLKELFSLVSHDGFEHIIISDENLLGPPTGHFFAGRKGRETGFYSSSELVFKALKIAFGYKLEKVFVTERGADSFLRSSHKNFVLKLQDSEIFSLFQQEMDDDYEKQYRDLFTNFRTIIGEQAHVFDFKCFISDYGKALDLVLSRKLTLPNKLTNKSNASISERGVELGVIMSKYLSSNEERNAFKKFLYSNAISPKQ
ncbi:hypothetical protein IGW68_01960 [Shewanella benthica]|uniref:glycosyltransferase family 32 protein n=1 Tax=Shewanella benthica TaxID=43661 RepID=UPI00187A246F|nr:glycosyltransferase [Shewanella benthica]MBE7213922.1 hypothetical protein [Shewanella benthica]